MTLKISHLVDHLVLLKCSTSFAPVTDAKIQLAVWITAAEDKTSVADFEGAFNTYHLLLLCRTHL